MATLKKEHPFPFSADECLDGLRLALPLAGVTVVSDKPPARTLVGRWYGRISSVSDNRMDPSIRCVCQPVDRQAAKVSLTFRVFGMFNRFIAPEIPQKMDRVLATLDLYLNNPVAQTEIRSLRIIYGVAHDQLKAGVSQVALKTQLVESGLAPGDAAVIIRRLLETRSTGSPIPGRQDMQKGAILCVACAIFTGLVLLGDVNVMTHWLLLAVSSFLICAGIFFGGLEKYRSYRTVSQKADKLLTPMTEHALKCLNEPTGQPWISVAARLQKATAAT